MDMDSRPLIQPESGSESTKKRIDDSPLTGDSAEEAQGPGENTAEKPAKVQRTAGIFGVFSNLATGISQASQSVLEQAKEASKTLQKSIEDNTIIGGFNKMQNEFIQEKQARMKGPGVAPWTGAKNEDEMKRQILNLSVDKRNFIREPPAGANFEFDLESAMPVASILLEQDPELHKRRFELVPKTVTETAFWRNYFYRISLIKQSSLLTSESPDFEEKPRSDIDRDDISVASNLDLMDGSVVGDSDTHTAEHHPVMPNTPLSFKSGKVCPSDTSSVSEKEAEEGWEQELQQTLDSYEVVGGDLADNELELDQALAATEENSA